MKYLKPYKIYESKHQLEEVILSCFEEQIDNERIFILKQDTSEDLYFINLDLGEIFDQRPENHSIIMMKIVPDGLNYNLYVYKQTVGDLGRVYPEEYSNLEQSLDYLGYKIIKTDDFPRGIHYMKRRPVEELGSKFMRFMIYRIEEI